MYSVLTTVVVCFAKVADSNVFSRKQPTFCVLKQNIKRCRTPPINKGTLQASNIFQLDLLLMQKQNERYFLHLDFLTGDHHFFSAQRTNWKDEDHGNISKIFNLQRSLTVKKNLYQKKKEIMEAKHFWNSKKKLNE